MKTPRPRPSARPCEPMFDLRARGASCAPCGAHSPGESSHFQLQLTHFLAHFRESTVHSSERFVELALLACQSSHNVGDDVFLRCALALDDLVVARPNQLLPLVEASCEGLQLRLKCGRNGVQSLPALYVTPDEERAERSKSTKSV